jgi:hypothetical protein
LKRILRGLARRFWPEPSRSEPAVVGKIGAFHQISSPASKKVRQTGDDLDAKRDFPYLPPEGMFNHALLLFVGSNNGDQKKAFLDILPQGRVLLADFYISSASAKHVLGWPSMIDTHVREPGSFAVVIHVIGTRINPFAENILVLLLDFRHTKPLPRRFGKTAEIQNGQFMGKRLGAECARFLWIKPKELSWLSSRG